MAANAMFDMPQRRKNKEYKDFMPYELFSDRELREGFRFGHAGIKYISDLLRPKLERVTRRGHALTVEQQVLTALRFFASGSFLQCIGDGMGIDKSTVSRVVTGVTDALVDIRQDYIKWPSETEKGKVRQGFFHLGGFPNVIGCIDGTHVRIQAPKDDEKSYVNRKNFHSINVMAVCDDKGI